ncbi:hypothetical protein CANARDRAFT_26128 [[Candida] arabinofermentans NRRL YB-2248]|uniref:SMP-30/Gluconolactonase/LRE-like region domain-containing protein n=1 Tax=[Candida] arabinofermentans NRRL YB-2248 TaxID=983967 RepID=A0A1E4T881_9ASCO|nr:hypothetical protein CANARDRAFT_26128 [[Candida] arabinofermentans NRRL YB-2248]
MVKSTVIKEPFINFKGRLAEGVSYNSANNSLIWVDIIAGTINRKFLSSKSDDFETHKIDDSIGVIGLTTNPDVYLCGVSKGIAQFNFSTKEFKYVAEYPAKWHMKEVYGTQMRSNDGSVAPNGEFFVGTMSNFDEDVSFNGKLYKFDSEKIGTEEPQVVIDSCSIPNGLNWFDGYMYFTNSSEHKIFKFKCIEGTYLPDLSTKETYVDITQLFKGYNGDEEKLCKGEPDGSCMDSEGNLYIAVWGTNRVIKIGYKSGKFEEEWIFPAERISCVTIGGENFDELFVTSADLHLDDVSKLGSVPGDLGGSLFNVKLSDAKGLPKNIWSGKLVV